MNTLNILAGNNTLVRVSKSTLSEVDKINLGAFQMASATAGSNVYVAFNLANPAQIGRVDVSSSTMSNVTLTLGNTSDNFPRGMTVLGDYLFLSSTGRFISKIPLATLNNATSTINSADYTTVSTDEFDSAVIFGAGGYLYAGVGYNGRALTLTKLDPKISVPDAPSVIGRYSTGATTGSTAMAHVSVTDGQYAYFVSQGDPAILWKVDLRVDSPTAAPEVADSLNLGRKIVDDNPDRSRSPGMAIKDRSLYLSTHIANEESTLLHIDLDTFTVTDTRTLTGIERVVSLTIEGSDMFMVALSPRKVYRLAV